MRSSTSSMTLSSSIPLCSPGPILQGTKGGPGQSLTITMIIVIIMTIMAIMITVIIVIAMAIVIIVDQ